MPGFDLFQMVTAMILTGSRDRENTTVFVAELPASATEDDLKALFKDVRTVLHFVGTIC